MPLEVGLSVLQKLGIRIAQRVIAAVFIYICVAIDKNVKQAILRV